MLPALKAHPYKGKGEATRVDSWAVGEEPESRFPGHSRVFFGKQLAFFFIHGEVLFLPEARTIGGVCLKDNKDILPSSVHLGEIITEKSSISF